MTTEPNQDETAAHIESVLGSLSIEFQKFSHPAVMTCAEAEELCPEMPGIPTKNLFLKKSKKYYLVTLRHDREVNLKELSAKIGAKNASFASPVRLDEVLKIKPGSVGLLALINDEEAKTKVFVDSELFTEPWLQSHPGVNTQTFSFNSQKLDELMKHTGHEWHKLEL